MRVSKQESEKNRREILQVAEKLFRERGFDGVGVADLMKAAGFTHGGFYNHFSGKDELEREAVKAVFERSNAELKQQIEAGGWKEYARDYLTPKHRDDPATGCPMASLAPDAIRKGPELQSCFSKGIEEVVDALAQHLKDSNEKKPREKAMQTLSELVGAMILSRAVAAADPKLSRGLLSATRNKLAGRR
jgi:TetR/AcrR family transcriptional regulator, transcriptional repressor for nem operon